MIIFKVLFITSLCLGQASRPAVNTDIFDYELSASINAKMVEHLNEGKLYTRVLFEREEGRRGTGHDIEFSFKTKDILFNKVDCRRSVSSYHRAVKDISLQTVDCAYYVLKPLMLGYSLGFTSLSDMALFGYGVIDFTFLTYQIRINPSNTIHKIRLYYNKKGNKIEPFIRFDYLNTGDTKDWRQEIGICFKFS